MPPSNATAIANALKALPNQHNATTADRLAAEDLLHQSQADEAQADDLARQWQTLRETADGADDAAAKIEAALAQDDSDELDAWRKNLPTHASSDQLESMLASERASLTASRSAVTALDAEIHHQSTRPTQIREELTAAYASLDASSSPTTQKADSAPVATARRLRALSAERLATIQIALLELENRSYEPRMRLLSAQLRQRQRTISELGQHVSTLESMLLNRTDEYVDDLRTRVMQQSAQVPPQARLSSEAANENIALTNQLAQTIARLSELRVQKQELDSTRQETEQALENTNERIRIGGVSEAVGLILLAEQRKLKSVSLLKRQLASLQTELATARMDLIAMRERQSALTDIDAAVDKTMKRAPNIPGDKQDDVRARLRELLGTRVEIVAQLTAQLRRLAESLGEAEQEQTDVTDTTAELAAKLDERLLWTPSHAAVSAAWLLQLPADTFNFFYSRRWLASLAGAGNAAIARPISTAIGIVTLIIAFLLKRRAPKRLEALAIPMRRIRSDRYLLTGEALAWTALMRRSVAVAGVVAQPAFSAGQRQCREFLRRNRNSVPGHHVPIAVLAFMRALTMEKGLAQYHFRWPRPRREALHRAAPILALIGVPTAFLMTMMTRPDIDAPLDTFGRSLLVLSLIAAGGLSWWLFAPGTPLDRAANGAGRTDSIAPGHARVLHGDVRHFRRARVAGLCRHRRHARDAFDPDHRHRIADLDHARTGRALAGARRTPARTETDASEIRIRRDRKSIAEGEARPELPDEEEITIANLSAQTRRLLRALTIVVTVSVMLWVWSDVTPALSYLGNRNVWTLAQVVDGKELSVARQLARLDRSHA